MCLVFGRKIWRPYEIWDKKCAAPFRKRRILFCQLGIFCARFVNWMGLHPFCVHTLRARSLRILNLLRRSFNYRATVNRSIAIILPSPIN